MIANLGAMTVRLIKKQGTEIFGIRTLPIGVWSPISKEEMRKAHTTAPNGIELEPEDGVIYTEIMREKFCRSSRSCTSPLYCNGKKPPVSQEVFKAQWMVSFR